MRFTVRRSFPSCAHIVVLAKNIAQTTNRVLTTRIAERWVMDPSAGRHSTPTFSTVLFPSSMNSFGGSNYSLAFGDIILTPQWNQSQRENGQQARASRAASGSLFLPIN